VTFVVPVLVQSCGSSICVCVCVCVCVCIHMHYLLGSKTLAVIEEKTKMGVFEKRLVFM